MAAANNERCMGFMGSRLRVRVGRSVLAGVARPWPKAEVPGQTARL